MLALEKDPLADDCTVPIISLSNKIVILEIIEKPDPLTATWVPTGPDEVLSLISGVIVKYTTLLVSAAFVDTFTSY